MSLTPSIPFTQQNFFLEGYKQVRMQTRGALQHTQTPALDRSAIGTKLNQTLTHMTNQGSH